MKKEKTNFFTECGAVILETAIALPFLLYIAFMGYELTRLSELQLAKRDIIRVLSLSHVCGFRQSVTPGNQPPILGDAATRCYQESINRITRVARERFPQMQVYIQTYVVFDDPSTPADNEMQTRLGRCNNQHSGTLPVIRIAKSVKPVNFQSKFGFPEGTEVGNLGTAINQDNMDTRMQLCLNGQITIAEFNIDRRPIFGSLGGLLGGNNQTPNTENQIHYEFGAI